MWFLDPIYIFNIRLKNKEIKLCENVNTKHICYKDNSNYNFANKNGIICITLLNQDKVVLFIKDQLKKKIKVCLFYQKDFLIQNVILTI